LILRNSFFLSFLRSFLWVPFYFLVFSLWGCGGGGGSESGSGSGGGLSFISGRITSGGSGLAGVTVTLTGGTSSLSTSTDAAGNYQFSNLVPGPLVITPSKAGCTFDPSSRTVMVMGGNIMGQDFSASGPGWAKTYGGSNYEGAHCIRQTSDGGFIMAGETYSFGAGNSDIWVFKLDVMGDIQWQKTYGGSGYDLARSIQQTSDGGYIVAGEASSFAGDTETW